MTHEIQNTKFSFFAFKYYAQKDKTFEFHFDPWAPPCHHHFSLSLSLSLSLSFLFFSPLPRAYSPQRHSSAPTYPLHHLTFPLPPSTLSLLSLLFTRRPLLPLLQLFIFSFLSPSTDQRQQPSPDAAVRRRRHHLALPSRPFLLGSSLSLDPDAITIFLFLPLRPDPPLAAPPPPPAAVSSVAASSSPSHPRATSTTLELARSIPSLTHSLSLLCFLPTEHHPPSIPPPELIQSSLQPRRPLHLGPTSPELPLSPLSHSRVQIRARDLPHLVTPSRPQPILLLRRRCSNSPDRARAVVAPLNSSSSLELHLYRRLTVAAQAQPVSLPRPALRSTSSPPAPPSIFVTSVPAASQQPPAYFRRTTTYLSHPRS